MINELLKLRQKLEEIENLKAEFRKHLPEVHDLAQQYVDNTGDYIERGLGNIEYIDGDTVTFTHFGWEFTGGKDFPLELFTNPSFLKDVIKNKEDREAKKRREFEDQQREEYEYLKHKFEK